MRKIPLLLIASALTVTSAVAQLKATAAAPPATATASATVQPKPQPSLESARRIDRDKAMKLVAENKAVFVDVRAKEAYDVGHIKGAVSIPEFELINRLKEIPAGRMIITYCA